MDILTFGDPGARTVLVQPVDGHDLAGIDNELRLIRESSPQPFRLIAVKVGSWNRDLSPWSAPAVFGDEGFEGKAQETLDGILPLLDEGCVCHIGGYSLAGLFALWAVCRTDRFRGAAAASPSVWFPGFLPFLQQQAVHASAVYLSLGDREEKARSPVLSAVGDRIRETDALLESRHIPHILEWNEGNHFRDGDIRTAKAFAWLLNR